MHPTHRPLVSFRRPKGFTLVELMVTVALAALLMTLSIPGFFNLLRAWQRDSATRSFITHISLARSEAIRTSRRVVMCSSTNGASCAGSRDWRTGWIVFADLNGDGALNDNEPLSLSRGVFPGVANMAADRTQLTFMPNGLMASDSTSLAIVPDGNIAVQSNVVTLNRIGRAYITAQARRA